MFAGRINVSITTSSTIRIHSIASATELRISCGAVCLLLSCECSTHRAPSWHGTDTGIRAKFNDNGHPVG